MKSIRRFQIVALVTGALVLVTAVEAYDYISVRRALYDQADAALTAKAAAFASLMDYDPPAVELDFDDEKMPEFSREIGPLYFQIWINDRPFTQSRSLGDGELPREYGSIASPKSWNLELRDGRRGRAVGISFPIALSDELDEPVVNVPTGIVVIAQERETLEAALATIRNGFVVTAIVMGGLLALLISWTIARAMRPVRALADATERIDESSLESRVPAQTLPIELQPIAAALNRLLDRLEGAFHRERRTTANIAHELRTPIAELRLAAEVAERWPEDVDLARRAVLTARHSSQRMERTVSLLLELARFEGGHAPLAVERLDLTAIIAAGLERHEAAARTRSVTLDFGSESTASVLADRAALELLMDNLISNAVSHAPQHSVVRIALESNGERRRVEIVNDAPHLKPHDLARLTEPFWRKDESRADSAHCGLGLTLARSVGQAAGFDLTFDLVEGRFVATMTVQAATIARPASRSASAPATSPAGTRE